MQAMLTSRPRMVLHEAAYKSPPQVKGARERRIETATTALYVEPSAEPMGAGGDRQHVACPTDADGGNAAKAWHSLTGSSCLFRQVGRTALLCVGIKTKGTDNIMQHE